MYGKSFSDLKKITLVFVYIYYILWRLYNAFCKFSKCSEDNLFKIKLRLITNCFVLGNKALG